MYQKVILAVVATMLVAAYASHTKNTSDYFSLTSVAPVNLVAASFCAEFAGDNLDTCGEPTSVRGITMKRNYTIKSIAGFCSTGFTGGTYSACILERVGSTAIVCGPVLVAGEVAGKLAKDEHYTGLAGERLSPYWLRGGSATFPGYCRMMVSGVYR